MQIYRKKAAQMLIANKIGIGDPGYSDVEYEFDVVPGDYNCYSWTGYEKGLGTRVWMNEIVLDKDYADELSSDEKNWEDAGLISVDSGMAGYFINKPTFDEDDDWMKLCEWTWNKKNCANSIKDTYFKNDIELIGKNWLGFWTNSGFGDGVYPLKKLLDGNDRIIGLRLTF